MNIVPSLMLDGVPIMESDFATTTEGEFPTKRWHRFANCYRKRMEKKWAQKYGAPVQKPAILVTNIYGRKTFFVHPDLMPKLRAAIAKATP